MLKIFIPLILVCIVIKIWNEKFEDGKAYVYKKYSNFIPVVYALPCNEEKSYEEGYMYGNTNIPRFIKSKYETEQ